MGRTCAAGSWIVLLVVLAGLGGCSATINPALRQDAQTAARVKTALVNDPVLGVRPIQVRVTNGVVQLIGQVATDAEVAQVVALVRRVPGVTDVQPMLRVAPPGTPAEPGEPDAPRPSPGASAAPPPYEEPIVLSSNRGMLAIGASIRLSDPRATELGSRVSIGPSVRLGFGTGPGLAIGFGWMGADLHATSDPSELLARVRIKPVMIGLGYTLRRQRLSTSLSLVGGMAFNRLTLPDRIDVAEAALAIDHSPAWRPGVSFWLDVDDRVAVNLFTGYLVTRPRMTVLEGGQTVERTLRADTLVVSAGVAYKLF